MALLLAGCAPSAPPLADAALSSAGPGEDVRVVYVVPTAKGCANSSLSGFAAYRDGLVLAENTCTPEAGGDDSEPQFRLVEASPAGVRELPLPEDVSSKDGVVVVGGSDEGVVFVATSDMDDGTTSLWQRSTGGEWSLLTRPAAYGDLYAGDGGPASEAVISNPQDVVVGRDGSIFVLEPNAVRRISPNGIIETVAGSDRLDPPGMADSFAWGSAGVPFVSPDPRPLPPGPVDAPSSRFLG